MIVKAGYFFCIALFSFIHFTQLDAQTFVLNGSSTALGGDCYQLTPDAPGLTSTFFSQNPIDLTQPFNLDATLFFGCKDGNGADGIDFIFATTNTALGVGGGGIGYQGITPSIAVEMDDYQNGNYGDPAADHFAIISMGNVDHTQPTNLAGPNTIPNIEDCMDHCFIVDWNPVTQTLTAVLDDETISYTGDIIANIFSGNPQVYFGFSAGTGGLSNIHRVCFGPPQLEPMEDVTICENESVELQADPNGVAWTWEPDPTLSSLNISNPTATPDVTSTYYTAIEYKCGDIHLDTVEVTVIPEPNAIASNNGPACEGESVTLMSSGGVDYDWSGPQGYSSSQQNPVINNLTIGMAGIYYVTVTDAFGCTAEAETEVEVDLGPEIEIEEPSSILCENNSTIQLTATPGGGVWSGDVSPSGIFDPSYVGEGIHDITYTSTNANGCTNSETISIEVFPIPDVIINPPGIFCEDDAAVQLTGNPSGGIWEGEITVNGIFDPGDAGEGIHLITYTANDGNGCTNSEDILIEVVQNLPVTISPPGPFCSSEGIVMLTANPPGGMWGGVADANGNINTTALGPGTHLVTYNVTNQNGCYAGQVTIEITGHPNVSINGIAPLCPDEPQQQLTATPPGGTWSGAADPTGIVDPSLLAPGLHNVLYTFELPNGCSTTDTFVLQILPGVPQIGNLNVACDSTATSYVVSFTISGGDPPSYTINGSVTGTLIPGNPAIFFSEPIPSGVPYNFSVTDMFLCDTATISGTFLCNCGTNAGMMNLNAIEACEGEVITVLQPSGVVLDPDDTLTYVLHLGFPDSIILTSSSNVFQFAPPLVTGTTYFISSVAGSMLPGGGIDFSDPCLSASFGTPVSWSPYPSGYLSAPPKICEGDTALITFNLSGSNLYNVVYTDGVTNYGLGSITSGQTLEVYPATTTVYSLLNVMSLTGPGCSSDPDTSVSIEVIQITNSNQSASICAGDSIFLENDYQTSAGVYYDTLTSIDGCDSVIITSLTLRDGDTTNLFDSSCDIAQVGVFTSTQSNQFGCDSTVILTVIFAEADTSYIASNTCDLQSAGVFSTTYIAQNGCDSLVVETVTFIPADTTNISGQTCDESAAGVFTTMLNNIAGCDSLIIETIEYISPDTTLLSGETCDAGSAGTFQTILSNTSGCDSIIIETILLLASDTTLGHTATCNPLDTGILMLSYVNVDGCDSLVILITSLAPFDTCNVVVISKDVFIPNVFSPNGDGFNDLFLVFSNPEAGAKISFLRIFDRWGGLVFERNDINPNDPQHGWNGMERGKFVNPGVYVFAVQLIYPDGVTEILTGDITVTR